MFWKPAIMMPQLRQETDTSLTGRAYDNLRRDIIKCRLQPNERLRLEELRDRYGLGASPIREALMRLEAEGLVCLEQNKGFRVLPVSKEHLLDLMRVRTEIDSLCLRWSIENGGVDWEVALVGALHRLNRLSKSEQRAEPVIADDWGEAHRAFHFALISACDSPMFKAMHTALFDQVERYVAISISIADQPRDDTAEHEALVRSALARDADEGVALLRAHLKKTEDKLSSALFDPKPAPAKRKRGADAAGKPEPKAGARLR